MRAWGWLAVLSILASPAHAQSLGDVAKRDRERREKKKQEGTETKVIRDEDLVAAAPGKDSKGTFNSGTGSVSVSGSPGAASQPVGAPGASASPGSEAPAAPLSEIEGKRAAARRRLESSYEGIAVNAWSLIRAVREFQGCQVQTPRCLSLVRTIDNLAISVGTSMDEAEDAARQGWLPPGDVRAIRERFGLDGSVWDELGRAVRQIGAELANDATEARELWRRWRWAP